MTTSGAPPKLGTGSTLDFHGPMSPARASRLVAGLAAREPATVVDYGCGWGELLLRLLAAVPEAHGTGIDIHGPDIARARAAAADRGLTGRATFIEGPARDHARPADVVLSLGAYHAFGTIPEALAELRTLVNPGGRLLFGAEIWDRTPTEAELAAMWPGTTADECLYLPDLVEVATAAGLRPLRIETSTRAEWEEFESGYAADTEEWLLANPGHPDAPETREKLDAHLGIWLRGLHQVFSYAFLTLGVPG
ncbi:class I SAM-dependent methyltransferase [Catenulispora subtropica]|uniref:Class I SAM-dependent methyltransferase n=1 Tax=Catenulispora subtropica TaxID=450798 RepID=A0ABP5D867_9ACTN